MFGTTYGLKVLFVTCLLLGSFSASAMTACPPETTDGKPWAAWLALSSALVAASIVAFAVGRRGLLAEAVGIKIAGILGGIGLWALIVYGGFLGWVYYRFTCF